MKESKVLVFDTELSGHHLEYMHHLYMKAGEECDKQFIFAVSELFRKNSAGLDWPSFSNIHFHYISLNEIASIKSKKYILLSYYVSKYLISLVREYQINHIFLISIMQFMPALPFLLPKNVRLSGIVYLIYLYRWRDVSWSIKLLDVLKYLIFSYSRGVDQIYILNDEAAAKLLNQKYQVNKFGYLPDPYIPQLINESIINAKSNSNKLMLLHFGMLAERKGTLDILKAIESMDSSACSKLHLVLAGEVDHSIKQEFLELLSHIKHKIELDVYDGFCSFDFLATLCRKADYILIPYKETGQSSGLIGYAAQFGVPVIGPRKGLIGKLIKKYNLGYCLESVTPYSLSYLLSAIGPFNKNSIRSNKYLKDHSIEEFLKYIKF